MKLGGRGFDANAAGNRVSVAERPALLLQASASELTIAVPGTRSLNTPVPVTVGALGVTSTSAPLLTVLRPSAASLLPRFFPEPAAQHASDRVLVSSELGPVMLLSGRGDAGSLPERALRVAAALNALLEGAQQKPAVLELREQPAPAVAVAGGSSVLATVTPEDVAGYAALGAGRPGAREIAAHWAALLQDHVDLFARQQRPFRVAERTARGKLLLDLFAEVRRRRTGLSVSPVVVEGFASAQARALRELALAVPPEGASSGGLVAVGLWDGQLQQTGEAVRRVSLRLVQKGSSLAGALSTGSAGVSALMPLLSAGYERGTLRFSVSLGGTPLSFSGALAGDTLQGSLEKEGRAAGTFSLRWVE